MKQCLVDVNLGLALLVKQHEHHRWAEKWFEQRAAGEVAVCRIVQLSVVRLLSNRSVMGDDAMPASAAWKLFELLLEDERVEFVAEPAGIDALMPGLFKYTSPTGKLVADAYLAAFAVGASMRLATFDRGFRQFRELDVTLLGRNVTPGIC
jgi:toxin-antitoxin system PIN domain toxin